MVDIKRNSRLHPSPIIGSRAFRMADVKYVWNSPPEDNYTTAPTQSTFRRNLKTHLFELSLPHFTNYHCSLVFTVFIT